MNKQKLRHYYKEKLAKLTPIEKKNQTTMINHQLSTWLNNHHPKKLGVFYPQQSEPNIWPIIKPYAETNDIYMPKFDKSTNHYHWAQFSHQLEMGQFNIPEPTSPVDNSLTLCACLVPALAIDSQLNRLGYGFGYFDRLLSTSITHRIGIVFNCQISSKNFPVDHWDIPLTQILK